MKLVLVDLSRSRADFIFVWVKAVRSTMHIQAWKCCIEPALVLFLSSNCTHILVHCEINSTRGKYSVKSVVPSVAISEVYHHAVIKHVKISLSRL